LSAVSLFYLTKFFFLSNHQYEHSLSPSAMGNGVAFRKKKEIPKEPKPPLTTLAEIVNSAPAKERIIAAMNAVAVGSPRRWESILKITNRVVMPSEDNPDPININVNLTELIKILVVLFHEVKFITSDGLALAREKIPEMYDKHSVERASKLSAKEREDKELMDDYYAYGEVDHEIFATLYLKVVSVYGAKAKGIFYDLGCGVGTLVSHL
jgi:hypothetical protein